MSIKREDLRVVTYITETPEGVAVRHRAATDADLAALGYVKVDVDAETVREANGLARVECPHCEYVSIDVTTQAASDSIGQHVEHAHSAALDGETA